MPQRCSNLLIPRVRRDGDPKYRPQLLEICQELVFFLSHFWKEPTTKSLHYLKLSHQNKSKDERGGGGVVHIYELQMTCVQNRDGKIIQKKMCVFFTCAPCSCLCALLQSNHNIWQMWLSKCCTWPPESRVSFGKLNLKKATNAPLASNIISMTIKPLLEQRLSPNIIIPYCRDRGAEQRKRNKAVHLNLIHQCRTDVQESENWIPPLVDKFKPFPARRRRIFILHPC